MTNPEIVQSALDILHEHFDSCQIMVSWNEEGFTRYITLGSGNWYARQGMAHEFINSDISRDAAAELAKVINPPEE